MTTHTIDERETRLAWSVMDMLDRWDARLQGHLTQKREHDRKKFRSLITVLYSTSDESDEAASIKVWSRNLSQGGMSFVYRGQIKPANVVVCLNPDQGETLWYQAEIMRSRQVHNDYWEYGVRFAGSAEV